MHLRMVRKTAGSIRTTQMCIHVYVYVHCTAISKTLAHESRSFVRVRLIDRDNFIIYFPIPSRPNFFSVCSLTITKRSEKRKKRNVCGSVKRSRFQATEIHWLAKVFERLEISINRTRCTKLNN